MEPYESLKSMTSSRLAVADMPEMMASNLPAFSAGVMPSKFWATILHSTFMWSQRYLAELDLVAVERAVRLGEVVGLEGAFGGDRHCCPLLVFAHAPVAAAARISGGRCARQNCRS